MAEVKSAAPRGTLPMSTPFAVDATMDNPEHIDDEEKDTLAAYQPYPTEQHLTGAADFVLASAWGASETRHTQIAQQAKKWGRTK